MTRYAGAPARGPRSAGLARYASLTRTFVLTWVCEFDQDFCFDLGMRLNPGESDISAQKKPPRYRGLLRFWRVYSLKKSSSHGTRWSVRFGEAAIASSRARNSSRAAASSPITSVNSALSVSRAAVVRSSSARASASSISSRASSSRASLTCSLCKSAKTWAFSLAVSSVILVIPSVCEIALYAILTKQTSEPEPRFTVPGARGWYLLAGARGTVPGLINSELWTKKSPPRRRALMVAITKRRRRGLLRLAARGLIGYRCWGYPERLR